MKRILIICYTALFAAFTAPFLLRAVLPPSDASAAPDPSPLFTVGDESESAAEENAQTVRVLIGGEPQELGMTEYLTGVVAAEMPASFEENALRAQAVAARTYEMYCARACRHENADVCAESGCCQAYLSADALKARWGADYERYYAKLRAAVTDTAGEYLSYEGEPIFAAFHSSSAGATEASGGVWNALPYLVSVSSPESAENVPGYVSYVEVSVEELSETLIELDAAAEFSGAEETWIGETCLDESGRVAYVSIGGRKYSGGTLRSTFGLRSTAFTIEYTGGSFLFTVTGYGHGVGMSQYGANVMAARGADYTEILSHYYPGTELVSLS